MWCVPVCIAHGGHGKAAKQGLARTATNEQRQAGVEKQSETPQRTQLGIAEYVGRCSWPATCRGQIIMDDCGDRASDQDSV